MNVILAGSGPHMCRTPLASGVSYGGTTGVDTAFVSTSLNFSNTSNNGRLKAFGPLSEGWLHFEANYSSNTASTSTRFLATLEDSSGVVRIRLRKPTDTLFLEYHDGATLTAVGPGVATSGGRKQFDIYFKIHATEGVVEFYQNKVLVDSFTGDTTGLVDIAGATFGNPTNFGTDSCQISQILIADGSTLFAKVAQDALTVAGSEAGWTGGVTDIDELTEDTVDYISADAVDLVSTFKRGSARDLTGYSVEAVVAHFHALRGGSAAPAFVAPVLGIGGTVYEGSSKAMTFGRSSHSEIFATNPATAAAWTAADAGSADLEVGVKSKAA